MKTFKKVLSIVLSVTLVLSMTVVPSFASKTTVHDITVTNDTGDHEYGAYQIFKGDLVKSAEYQTYTNDELKTLVPVYENSNGTGALKYYTDANGKKVADAQGRKLNDQGIPLSETKTLTNVEWGDGIDRTATDSFTYKGVNVSALNFVSALKEVFGASSGTALSDTDFAALDPATATAEDVLACLDGKSTAVAQQFADIADHYLAAKKDLTVAKDAANNNAPIKNADGKYHYDGTVTGDGYYLIKDTNGLASTSDAYTDFILRVVDDIVAEAKSDVPTNLDKKILDPYDENGNIEQAKDADGNLLYYAVVDASANPQVKKSPEELTTTPTDFKVMQDANGRQYALRTDNSTASIGEYVKYEIRATIPDMSGYDKYYFIGKDKLSKGLTYVNDTDHPTEIKVVAHTETGHLKDVELATLTQNAGAAADKTIDGSIATSRTADAKTYWVRKSDVMDNQTPPQATGETQLEFIFNDFLQYQNSLKNPVVKVTDNNGVVSYREPTSAELTEIMREDANATPAKVAGQATIGTDTFQLISNPVREVVITYWAQVDSDAVIGDGGNPNDVTITYSNDPNTIPDGDNEPGPGDDNVTGVTPEERATVYVTQLEINKVAQTKNDEKLLAGAEFSVVGIRVVPKITTTENFVEDGTGSNPTLKGTYYKLADGTYTEKAPNADTYKKYEDTQNATAWDANYPYKKYHIETTVTYTNPLETTPVSTKLDATNGGNTGIFTLGGLGAGTYVIRETKAPSTYNLLKEPIVVTTKLVEDTTTTPTTYKWEGKQYTWAGGTAALEAAAANKVPDTVTSAYDSTITGNVTKADYLAANDIRDSMQNSTSPTYTADEIADAVAQKVKERTNAAIDKLTGDDIAKMIEDGTLKTAYDSSVASIAEDLNLDNGDTTKNGTTLNGNPSTAPAAQGDQGDYFELKIQNSQGSELPETGGMGTTILYIIGGILVVVAGVLLITRRRMATR